MHLPITSESPLESGIGLGDYSIGRRKQRLADSSPLSGFENEINLLNS